MAVQVDRGAGPQTDGARRALGLLETMVAARLRAVEGEEARRQLAWLLDAVTTLKMLDARLAETGSTDFAAYVEMCADAWRKAAPGRGLTVEVHAESAVLPQELYAGLAFVLSELIGNAVRHAFPEGRPGRVTVALVRSGGLIDLTVADDGPGPAALDPKAGLTLASALAEHLGGTLTLTPRPGLTARLTLPDPDPETNGRRH